MRWRIALMLCCVVVMAGCWETDDPPESSTPGTTTSDSVDSGGKSPAPAATPDCPHGRFEGEVVASWNSDGRDMTLREDFAYVDAEGKRWDAPAGSVVNGASIPRAFWSVIGGPFEGPYRNASVIHDVACVEMHDSWEDVHRAFYEACLCGGVGESKAKLLYWAVYNFGPRWDVTATPRAMFSVAPDSMTRAAPMPAMPMAVEPMPEPDEELVKKAEAFFATENPSLEEIEKLKF